MLEYLDAVSKLFKIFLRSRFSRLGAFDEPLFPRGERFFAAASFIFERRLKFRFPPRQAHALRLGFSPDGIFGPDHRGFKLRSHIPAQRFSLGAFSLAERSSDFYLGLGGRGI